MSIGNGSGQAWTDAGNASGDGIMTSPDGVTWTIRSTPEDNYWRSIAYNGVDQFAVCSNSGTNRIMTSP